MADDFESVFKALADRSRRRLLDRLFVENGPAVTAAEAQPPRSSTVYRAWGDLSREHRLAVVERALHPANDVFDEYPVAL